MVPLERKRAHERHIKKYGVMAHLKPVLKKGVNQIINSQYGKDNSDFYKMKTIKKDRDSIGACGDGLTR